MAEIIKGVVRSLNVPFIFKAPTTRRTARRSGAIVGGMKEGLRILKKSREVHVPVLTDVHQVADVAAVPKSWTCCRFRISCRQTDLIVAAALSGRPVNIKKGSSSRLGYEACRS